MFYKYYQKAINKYLQLLLKLSHLSEWRLNKFPMRLCSETIKKRTLLKFSHPIQT